MDTISAVLIINWSQSLYHFFEALNHAIEEFVEIHDEGNTFDQLCKTWTNCLLSLSSSVIVVMVIMLYNYSSGLDIIDEEAGANDNNDDDGDEGTDEVFHQERDNVSTVDNMLQFTRSLSAINAMSLGVQVLKAKVTSSFSSLSLRR